MADTFWTASCVLIHLSNPIEGTTPSVFRNVNYSFWVMRMCQSSVRHGNTLWGTLTMDEVAPVRAEGEGL